MNHCQFAGVVSESAELSQIGNGVSKCEFKMKVGKGGTDKEYEIPLQAWAQVADKYASALQKGAKVLVSGAYEPRVYESKFKQGQMNTIHTFTAKDILLLSQQNNSQYSFIPENIEDLPWK